MSQQAKLEDSNLTPSGRILETMEQQQTPWFHFAMAESARHARYFGQRPLTGEKQAAFTRAAVASLEQQRQHDAQPEPPFDDFLRAYYDQYQQV